jgi:hypothetical protein
MLRPLIKDLSFRLGLAFFLCIPFIRTSASFSMSTSSPVASVFTETRVSKPPLTLSPSCASPLSASTTSLRTATSYLIPSNPACRTSQIWLFSFPGPFAPVGRVKSCRIICKRTECTCSTERRGMCKSKDARVCETVSRTGATTWSETKSPNLSRMKTQRSLTASPLHHRSWQSPFSARDAPTDQVSI